MKKLLFLIIFIILFSSNVYGWPVYGKYTPLMMQTDNSPIDGYCLTYEASTGNFEWQVCGAGMVYPGTGVALSTGSAWGTSLSTDGSGDCSSGAVCLGGHTHSGYLTSVASDSDWTVHNNYPTACTGVNFVQGIGDTLTCAQPSNITGNAATATALAANGANCSSGQAPLGVDASGAVEGCFTVVTSETDPIVKAINGLVYSNGSTISAATLQSGYIWQGNGSNVPTAVNSLNISTLDMTAQTSSIPWLVNATVPTTYNVDGMAWYETDTSLLHIRDQTNTRTLDFYPKVLADTLYAPVFVSGTQNYFWATPNGSSGVPSLRAMVAADVPTLNQDTTGTAYKIPQGASPTIDAAGKVGIDTTANQLKYYGTAVTVIDPRRTKNITIKGPVSGDKVKFKVPYGMTVTEVSCLVDAATSAVLDVQECDVNGANCVTILSSTITCATTNTTGTVSDASIAANNYVFFNVGTVTGTVGFLYANFNYTITGE